jgi:hypothetical protein
MDYPTTETSFGPAQYSVQCDGELWIGWPDGLTLNGVKYRRVHGQTLPSGERCHLIREDDREATDAARSAVRAEVCRLKPLLVTPLAQARAVVDKAHGDLLLAQHAAEHACTKLADYRKKAEQAEAALYALEVSA